MKLVFALEWWIKNKSETFSHKNGFGLGEKFWNNKENYLRGDLLPLYDYRFLYELH